MCGRAPSPPTPAAPRCPLPAAPRVPGRAGRRRAANRARLLRLLPPPSPTKGPEERAWGSCPGGSVWNLDLKEVFKKNPKALKIPLRSAQEFIFFFFFLFLHPTFFILPFKLLRFARKRRKPERDRLPQRLRRSSIPSGAGESTELPLEFVLSDIIKGCPLSEMISLLLGLRRVLAFSRFCLFLLFVRNIHMRCLNNAVRVAARFGTAGPGFWDGIKSSASGTREGISFFQQVD